MSQSDGSTADYYQLPTGANTVDDITELLNMGSYRRQLFLSMLYYEWGAPAPDISVAEVNVRGLKELQDLIGMSNMNAQMGECFRAIYRYGAADHSSPIRDLKKIGFYLLAEVDRIERWCPSETDKLPQLHHMLDLNQQLAVYELGQL